MSIYPAHFWVGNRNLLEPIDNNRLLIIRILDKQAILCALSGGIQRLTANVIDKELQKKKRGKDHNNHLSNK